MLDKSTSPFLASLDRILADRGECLRAEVQQDAQSRKSVQSAGDEAASNAKEFVADIDAFLNTLTNGAVTAATSLKAASDKSSVKTTSSQGGEGSQKPAVTGAAASSSHLSAVLLADGLAAKLGVDTDTGTMAAGRAALLHVLLVKALESGGSVSRFSNVFGTKIIYSGGSVGTFALFTINGDLECSGNVYEYGGSLEAKDFQDAIRNYIPDPAKQMVFLRHSCHPPGQAR
jgi:hypothetical protein